MVSTTQITINTSGIIHDGYVVQIVNGVATAAVVGNTTLFAGITLQAASGGSSSIIQTTGLLSPDFFNLGDGYACAVGVNSIGQPVRATSSLCVSAPNWVGYCDGYGNIFIQPRRADNLNVADYGAKGDGTTDDFAAIQIAINTAAIVNMPVFLGGKTYAIGTELKISTSGLHIQGSQTELGGVQTTRIVALSGIRSIISIDTSNNSWIEKIILDADVQASYALYLQGSAFGFFEKCIFQNTLIDGVYLAPINDQSVATVNDTNSFKDCSCLRNGTLYVSTGMATTFGTSYGSTQVNLGSVKASCSIGSPTITFAGTTLTSLGLRAGDWVRLDISSPQYVQISTIDSTTQITCGTGYLPTQHKISVEFAIGRGDSYHEYQHDDNNLTTWEGGLLRSSAGSAFMIAGLYGPKIRAQVDTNGFFGVVISVSYGGQTYATDLDIYYEGNLASNIAYMSAQGILSQGIGSNTYIIAGASTNWGITAAGQAGLAIQPIGDIYSNIPVTNTWTEDFDVFGTLTIANSIDEPSGAGSTIDSSTSFKTIATSSAIIFTSTPTIAAGANAGGGTLILLLNIGSYTFTLQDNGTLPGSTLHLLASAVAIMPGQSMLLVWSGSAWYQLGTLSANIPTGITLTTTSYGVLPTDSIISVGTLSGAITITLESVPIAGRTVIIKDANGSASNFNITINGNGNNIDGNTTLVIAQAYGTVELAYNGTKWMSL